MLKAEATPSDPISRPDHMLEAEAAPSDLISRPDRTAAPLSLPVLVHFWLFSLIFTGVFIKVQRFSISMQEII